MSPSEIALRPARAQRDNPVNSEGFGRCRAVWPISAVASVTAILGTSWAGKKTMTATSGPGFSLMLENLGLQTSLPETPVDKNGQALDDNPLGGPVGVIRPVREIFQMSSGDTALVDSELAGFVDTARIRRAGAD